MAVFLLSFIFAACVYAQKKTTAPSISPTKLIVTSASFENRKALPVKHAYANRPGQPEQNVSPQLSWKLEKAQKQAIKSYAVLMWDRHPVAQKFVHWCVLNIPSSATSLPEDFSAQLSLSGKGEGIQMTNSYGNSSYGGPQPPKGTGVHEYEFWVVGLNTDETLNVSDPSMPGWCEVDRFKKAISGKILAEGKLVGKYSAR